MQVEALELKAGTRVEIDGDLYLVAEYFHQRTAQRRANVRLRLKNVKTGRVIDRTFLSHDRLERAEFETRKMQFLYAADGEYHFMDLTTYEQAAIPKEILGDSVNYLIDNLEFPVTYYKDQPVGVDLPTFVILKITDTEPSIKGDTVSNVLKRATTQTGLVVPVPLFVNEGESIKVDTRTGAYIERA
jgi:elongation factor P